MSQQTVTPQQQQHQRSGSAGTSGSRGQFATDQQPQGQVSVGGTRAQTQTQASPGQTGITAPAGQQFATRSYLPEGVRTSNVGVLNRCLADLTRLNMQLKHAHWNVKGVEFYQLHELFEDMIEDFDHHIDEVAERASALGGQALGTAADVVQNSSIPPLPREVVDGQTLLDELAYRLSVIDANLYQAIESASQNNDLDTVDLLNEVSRDVSESLWFVEAHLQR